MSGHKVIILPTAWKQLMGFDEKLQNRLAEAIYTLELEPRPSGCKKLKGVEGVYRLRVGNYRVIYEVFDQILVVQVIAIGNRKEIYE